MWSPSASISGRCIRCPPWKRLRPDIQASKLPSARESGATLRIAQHLSGSREPQAGIGVLRRQHCGIWASDPHVFQPEERHDLLAVAVRRAEDLAAVDEDNRDRRIDRSSKVQKDDGFRAEARDERDLAGELPVDHVLKHVARAPMGVAPVQKFGMSGSGIALVEGAREGFKQRHRAPP